MERRLNVLAYYHVCKFLEFVFSFCPVFQFLISFDKNGVKIDCRAIDAEQFCYVDKKETLVTPLSFDSCVFLNQMSIYFECVF